ncbi:DUF2570 domain-containing protein [Enterobacter kobei]|uniref:DUF2570 domain-containing protein n=1 Tax=Enterobacter kobei TaxID=208224 RepID=UPI0028D333F8|nr:DUF2570 domain-containing protein [Enterobacter kobei]WNP36234.1 DUF2570 domain-containing protein [Enterobacter kobei]
MLSLSTLRNYIPILFAVIICFFLYSLYNTNQQLRLVNAGLEKEDKAKADRIENLRSKNDDFAKTFDNFTKALERTNQIAEDERMRRNLAEQKNQRLQDEIKQALKNNQCSIIPVPDSVVDGLRQQADRVRNGESASNTNSDKPVK